MSQLVVKTGMVVGTAKSSVWSQVATQSSDRETVFALVNLVYAGESDVLEVSAVGAEILESVKIGLGQVAMDLEKMKEIVESVKSEIGEGLELVIAGAKMVGKQLIVVGVGEVEGQMRRGEEVGRIFSGSSKVSGVIGEVEEGDVFVLTTRELIQVVGREVLAQSLGADPPKADQPLGADPPKADQPLGADSQLERLAVVVHGQENSSGLACVVGRVGVGNRDIVHREIGKGEGKVKNKKKINVGKVWGRVKGLSKRPIKIRQEQKKQNMLVGVLLLVILLVGVGVGMVRRSRVVREGRYSNLESVVVSKITEASSIADLNPERAKDLLSQADGEIGSYLMIEEEEEYLVRANELRVDVEEAKQSVFRQEQVETKTLIELSVLGIESTEIMVKDKNGSVVLVDNARDRLVGVSMEDRSSWEVSTQGGSDSGVRVGGEIRALGIYDDYGYMVTGEGVEGISLGGDKNEGDLPAGRQVEPDDLWGEVTGIGMFGGNAYLLDTGQGEIWKYPRITNGFGARRRWLGAGIVLDLSRVVDMEVDGDIWIITSTGKLERYSRGVPVTFSMEGFPFVESGKLMDPKAIATTDTQVYVLEAGASRVVVFEMESGRYVKQLVSEEFSEGRRMVVEEGKGYVLTSDRVVEFGL